MATQGPTSVGWQGSEGVIASWADTTKGKITCSHDYHFPSFCLTQTNSEEEIVEMLDIWIYADVKFVIKQIQNSNKVY